MQPYLVYIAGRMSGQPNHGYLAFDEAEKALQALGYKTLNPTNHSRGVGTSLPYSYYIKQSIWDVMNNASAVAVLPEWEKSSGARLEVHLAVALGLEIYRVEDLLHQPQGRFPSRLIPKIELSEEQVLEGTWA